MRLYCDESGNTGCLTSKGKEASLGEVPQTHFVTGAVVVENATDEKAVMKRYRDFKLHCGCHDDSELKGSSLMTRAMNCELESFIDDVLDGTHFRACLYDKRFYEATAIMIAFLGPEARKAFPVQFYYEANELTLKGDGVFRAYASYSNKCDKRNSKMLVRALLESGFATDYPQSMCVTMARELEDRDDYAVLMLTDAPIDCYRNEQYQNLINVSSLMELVHAECLLNGIDPATVAVIHDESKEFEEEYEMALELLGCSIDFKSSERSLGVQLADNLAAIFFHVVRDAVQIFKEKREWQTGSEWILKTVAHLIKAIGPANIKFVLPFYDWAMLLTVAEMFDDSFPRECRGNMCFNAIYRDKLRLAFRETERMFCGRD